MPVLDDPKHEKFAQLLFQGVDDGAAYVQAGYKKNPGNASRLKNNEKIQGRVKELLEKSADISIYNKEWVIRELAANHMAAFACGQHSASVGALKLIGVEQGMFVERSKNDHTFNGDPENLDRKQLAAIALKANGHDKNAN